MRALIARFWKRPYANKLVRWGTELHDRFMLPYFIEQDMADVLAEMRAAGYGFQDNWFLPHMNFRFPVHGGVAIKGLCPRINCRTRRRTTFTRRCWLGIAVRALFRRVACIGFVRVVV